MGYEKKLCKCETHKVKEIGWWEHCPLKGNGHTEFAVKKCLDCEGVCGFPQSNFELALKEGTVETIQTLRKIISKHGKKGHYEHIV